MLARLVYMACAHNDLLNTCQFYLKKCSFGISVNLLSRESMLNVNLSVITIGQLNRVCQIYQTTVRNKFRYATEVFRTYEP